MVQLVLEIGESVLPGEFLIELTMAQTTVDVKNSFSSH